MSGIAAILLPNGRTAHSRFHVPIDIQSDSMCHITKREKLAELLISAKLLIVDETSMGHRYVFEAIDRSLRDIRNCDVLFGGLTVVLSGDWRQILPVIEHGSEAEIVNACLKSSYIWDSVHVFSLSINQRLREGSDEDIQEYLEFIAKIGEGRTGQQISDSSWRVEIPKSMQLCNNTIE